jgi:lipoprotein-anchoring transpeptidase ErfK/SrfK
MRIRVRIPSQRLDLLSDSGAVVRSYTISTGHAGEGCAPDSLKTPTGRFCIAEKIGDGAPPGTIFESRVSTGNIATQGDAGDLILTRILWLDGLDAENRNTRDRYIYIHGTNHEAMLGTKASHGCIRMSNRDVIDLFDRVAVGTQLTIEV